MRFLSFKKWQWLLGLLPLLAGVGLVLLASRQPSPPAQNNAPRITASQKVRIFLILPGDNGRHGVRVACHDSLVSRPLSSVDYDGTQPLKHSLNALLHAPAQPPQWTNSYNAFGHSSLYVNHIELKKGITHIALSGTLRHEKSCDDQRAWAQLQATIHQFAHVNTPQITLNGHRLSTQFRAVKTH